MRDELTLGTTKRPRLPKETGPLALTCVTMVAGMTLPTDPRDDQTRIPQQSTNAPAQPASEATTSPARRSRRWPWIAAAAAVVLAAGGTVYALMPSDEDEARDRCQTAISEKLKSPSTAKFGDVTVTSSEGDFGTYFEVSGTLDAQNGFGAMVRGEYSCKVTRENDGDWLVTESAVSNG